MLTFTQDEDITIDDWTVCSKCETFRPPRAHHCRSVSCMMCILLYM